MPQPVRNLLDLAHLKQLRLDAGPQAIALTFRPGAVDRLPLQPIMADSDGELRWSGERLILARAEEEAEERRGTSSPSWSASTDGRRGHGAGADA